MSSLDTLPTQENSFASHLNKAVIHTGAASDSQSITFGLPLTNRQDGIGQSILDKLDALELEDQGKLLGVNLNNPNKTVDLNSLVKTPDLFRQQLLVDDSLTISLAPPADDVLIGTGQLVDPSVEDLGGQPLVGPGEISISIPTVKPSLKTSIPDSTLSTYEQLIRDVKEDLAVGDTYQGHTVDAIIENEKTGLYAVGFINNITGAPLLVVRGTDDWTDALDDANPKGVGYEQFETGKADLEAWLSAISKDAIKNPSLLLPSITGESLGGAIAQSIAASYTHGGGLLDDVVTFNSPGIDSDIVGLLKTDNVDDVLHLVAYGDIVSLAGEAFLPGEYHLFDWDTETLKVLSIGDYILDKHNQEDDTLIGNDTIDIKTGLNTQILSLSPFSYWNHGNVSTEARADWALFNLELGLLSPLIGLAPGTIPAILSKRGSTELARGTLGGLLRELLEKRSDSPHADVILKAGHAIDVVGDALINNIKEWNQETWEAVAEWQPEIWTAIALSGQPAISYLSIGGVEAAEALASGGLLAATALTAGSVEAFEALVKGGAVALQALAKGNHKLAWEAILTGGDQAWEALNNRGYQAWLALLDGGENAWLALKNNGTKAWETLVDGGDRAWDLIKSGVTATVASINGKEIFQKFDSLGNLFERIETSADGQQVIDTFAKGVLDLRQYFGTDGKLFKKVDFLSDGQQVIDHFKNGVNDLRQYFGSDGKLFKKVDFLSNGQQIIDHFKDGVNDLRQYFGTDGKLFKKVDFLSDGQQVINLFKNGVNNLRQYFGSDGKLFKKVDFLSNGQQVIDHFKNGFNDLRQYFGTDGKLFKKVDFLSNGQQIIDHFKNGISDFRQYFGTDGKLFKKVDFLSNGQQIIDYYRSGVNYLRNYFGSDKKLFKKVDFLNNGQQTINYFQNGVNTLRNQFGSDGKLFKQVKFLTNGGQVQHFYRSGKEYLRRTWSNASSGLVEYAWDVSGSYLGKRIYNSVGTLISGTGSFFRNAPRKVSDVLKSIGIKF